MNANYYILVFSRLNVAARVKDIELSRLLVRITVVWHGENCQKRLHKNAKVITDETEICILQIAL